jgi:excisionase family DNA binding protein
MVMSPRTFSPVQPEGEDAVIARDALVRVRKALAAHRDIHKPVRLTVEEDGETVTVPRAAVDLLVAVLANMAAGQGVSLVPSHAELTTQQAADLMNVSRPFLVRMLQAGDIEYRLVGTHRRIKAASLLDCMRRDDAQGRKAVDELSLQHLARLKVRWSGDGHPKSSYLLGMTGLKRIPSQQERLPWLTTVGASRRGPLAHW